MRLERAIKEAQGIANRHGRPCYVATWYSDGDNLDSYAKAGPFMFYIITDQDTAMKTDCYTIVPSQPGDDL